jgi:pimeloyl-ACP methyl ester carboxylesterase
VGRMRLLALACAVAIGAGACGDDDDSGTTAPTTTEVPGTTAAPTTAVAPTSTTGVPDEPGAILDLEETEMEGGVAYRVRYRSVSVAGEPIEVTGMVFAPDAEAVADRPVLAVAHGTVGMGDSCAPSLQPLDERSTAFVRPYLEAGYVVAASDFEGLGTPGLHPYIVGESEARGVIDSVRAARTIEGIGAGDRVVVWGHSQGGHAAMHTGQRWAELAPELELLGVAAGAPPSQFPLLADFLKGSDFQGYMVMVAAGFAAAYDELDLEAILTPEGVAGLELLESGCTAEVFGYYNALSYEQIVTVEDIFADPAWSARLVENDTNQRPVDVPLLILHGGADEQIPVASSELLLAQLCALGDAPAERRVYPDQSHAGAVAAYAEELLAWVADRFAAAPAADGCPGR